jgi:hypothetical protein
MAINPSSSSWPFWTNAPIVLFHGTTLASAKNILRVGIDLSLCDGSSDFGRGFYTTTRLAQANLFSETRVQKYGGTAAVVRLTLDRETLGSLKTIAFVRGDRSADDFWSFIVHCRKNPFHIPASSTHYDAAYGPVARKWLGPANSAVWEGYDQISFHTAAAVGVLRDQTLCSVEIE